MIKKRSLINTLACTYLFFCSSCANLEHINQYAHSSADGIKKFNDIPFSFSDYCNHYQQKALNNTLQTKIAPLPKLDCQLYNNSDSALKTFNHVLLAYLQGLEKLSASDLVSYDISNAATNLQTLQGKVIGLTINDAQVTATKNMANKLLTNLVNNYRKRKLKQIIKGSQGDFKAVVDGYVIALQGLQGEAKSSLQNYQFVFSDSLINATKETSLRILLVRDYHQQENNFEKTNQLIENYIKILRKIESGYVQLANSTDHLTADDLKTALQQSASDLKYLKAQMDDLKTSN